MIHSTDSYFVLRQNFMIRIILKSCGVESVWGIKN